MAIKGLDKYLTSAPEDSAYENWVEKVWNNVSDDEIPDEHNFHEEINKLLWMLYTQEVHPKPAAQRLIEYYQILK